MRGDMDMASHKKSKRGTVAAWERVRALRNPSVTLRPPVEGPPVGIVHKRETSEDLWQTIKDNLIEKNVIGTKRWLGDNAARIRAANAHRDIIVGKAAKRLVNARYESEIDETWADRATAEQLREKYKQYVVSLARLSGKSAHEINQEVVKQLAPLRAKMMQQKGGPDPEELGRKALEIVSSLGMINCPKCRGNGKWLDYFDITHGTTGRPCFACRGTGKVAMRNMPFTPRSAPPGDAGPPDTAEDILEIAYEFLKESL
jgi:hypothetical protein